MKLTLRQLEVFEAVARQSSFTRAAQELHLTQPAVSMQIKQLEDTVGQPLFEHVGKKFSLTAAGEEILRCARSISSQIGESRQVIEDLQGLKRGRLTVTVASTVNYFATRLLGDFSQRFKGVRVSLEVTNRQQLVDRLASNTTDIALMGQPPEGLDVEATPFMQNPLVVISPPGHPLNRSRSIPLSTLRKETFLMREPGSGTRIASERFFAEHGIELNVGIEMNSNEAIKQGVEAGLGLGIVSIHTVSLELEAGRLQLLDIEDFPILRQWFVVHRRGKRLSNIAIAFKDFVISESGRIASQYAIPEDK